jgi:hypothetical protein
VWPYDLRRIKLNIPRTAILTSSTLAGSGTGV